MGRASFGEEFRLGSQFDEVRRTLMQEQYADRLEKPLGYWVLPSDRRLPLAFLDRKLGELLSTPFAELSATPGIGQKKIHSLVNLLYRATRDEPPHSAVSSIRDNGSAENPAPFDARQFDPSVVSEALWSEWREAVRAANIADEHLGRLAPSLQRLPTVIWQAPLGNYLDLTVGEIRSLRTHGEKRVRCVLEVFHAVYHTLQSPDAEQDLRQALTSPRIRQVKQWIEDRLAVSTLPSEGEVRESFVEPLLEQLEIDSGSTVHRLAAERLGLTGTPRSVREQARQLSVTRARVYQLLDDCAKVINVRWPEGRAQLEQLMSHLAKADTDHAPLRLFFALRDLCFPVKAADDRLAERRKQHPMSDELLDEELGEDLADVEATLGRITEPVRSSGTAPATTPTTARDLRVTGSPETGGEENPVEEVVLHRSASPDVVIHNGHGNGSGNGDRVARAMDDKRVIEERGIDELREAAPARDSAPVSVGYPSGSEHTE